MYLSDHCAVGAWKSFLENNTDATIYHTPEWKRFIEETFHYTPYYIFVKDSSDSLAGLMPLFHVNSFLNGASLKCIPFSNICGYIGEPAMKTEVLEHVLGLYNRLKVKQVEIKEATDYKGLFHKSNAYAAYNLDLSQGLDSIRAGLGKDVRRCIRKSHDKGVTIRKSTAIEDVRQYYLLNSINKKKIGVPCHPEKFFTNLFTYMSDHVVLYLAEYDREIIGGLVVFYYRDTVLSGYSAAKSEFLHFYPNHAARWNSIEDGVALKLRNYDFGRVSIDNKGLREFKMRWGTMENELYYSYYPAIRKSLSNNRETLSYALARKALKSINLPLYRWVSEVIFKQFG